MVENKIISNWLKKKNWNLYEHQKKIIHDISKGSNVLLISPTGTGKTLSAFFPSIIDLSNKSLNLNILHTLYISPLKSLTYNIEKNIIDTIKDISLNISIASRTGDTSFEKKKKQLLNPPNILMTTIESFAILMSEKNSKNFFRNLKFVIIDEIHSLINTKRGELLTLNLTRLNNFNINQKILLSATISENIDSKKYFCSENIKIIKSNIKKQPVIKILGEHLNIPWSGHNATFAIKDIYKIIKKNVSIIYVNTRAQAELLFQSLWAFNSENLKIALHHGSLEKKIRMNVESKMINNELDCVIATSSLELGIDWSNIKVVIQIGAPKGITRLLQRIGRSNHNLKSNSVAYLVPTNRFEFLECKAAITAIKKNEIEEISTTYGSMDVLAQHIIGIACSSEININKLYDEILSTWPYRKYKKEKIQKIISFLENGGYSLEKYDQFKKLKKTKNGNYVISSEKFIRQYKMNVGTIIEGQMLEVKLKNKKLGKIEEWFVQKLESGDTFIFGGEVLKFNSISMNIVKVEKIKDKRPKIPSYAGGKMPISTKLADKVINIINNEKEWQTFPKLIIEWLKLQKKRSKLPKSNELLIEFFPYKEKKIKQYYYLFYTFQGYNVNNTLGFVLSNRIRKLGIKPLGFVCTDYVLAIWVDKEIENLDLLFELNSFKNSINKWLENSSLYKRNFNKVAIISGLINKGFPNQPKRLNQMSINSELILKVLNKYEKKHILIEATIEESKKDLIELNRLEIYLKKISSKIKLKKLKKPSPLSIPLMLQINNEVFDHRIVDEYYLKTFENDLLNEVGIS